MQAIINKKHNQLFLMIMLLLDLAVFSLLFPLIPDIIKHYIKTATPNSIDSWLPKLLGHINSLLPTSYSSEENSIILIGGALSVGYALLLFFSNSFWGKMSDRFGRKPILIISSLGSIAYGLVWLISDSFSLFILARFLGGLVAGNISITSAAMADMSPPEKRTSAMALIGAVFGLGFIIGPLLGGLSTNWQIPSISTLAFSVPAIFSILLSLASTLINITKFRETLKPDKQKKKNWIFNPFSALKEFPQTSYRCIILIATLYTLVFSSFEFTFSFFYSLEFGMKAKEIGLIFLYIGSLHILGNGFIVRFISKYKPPHSLLLIGFLLQPLPIMIFGISSVSLSFSLILLIPITLGSSFNISALNSLTSLSIKAEDQGHGLGLMRSFSSLSRAISPLVMAPIYWFFEVQITYAIFGFLSLCLFAFTLYTVPRRIVGKYEMTKK